MDESGGQVVQFSHFSVKEFLTSSRIAGSSADASRFHILLEPAHTIVVKACLGVLLRLGELVDEGETSRTNFLSLDTPLNIGLTMLDLRMPRPTYERG